MTTGNADIHVSGWRALRSRIAAGLRVPEACRGDQTAIIQGRVRTLAPVLAVLTVAWGVLDTLILSREHVPAMLLVRVGLAAALLVLARLSSQLTARLLVQAFVWMQAIGFGAIELLLAPDRDSALGIGYGLFPFVVAAQLSLFPMTWITTLGAALGPAAMLGVGMVAGGGVPAPWPWSDIWLLLLLTAVSAWTANAQLRLLVSLSGARRDASHDALTGLANRRLALGRLEAEQARCVRNGEPLSVLVLDLDHFKLVNDTWGHASGDVVLREVARALAGELRGGDLAARHGGEEFMGILPGTSLEQALLVAERVRECVEALDIQLPDASIRITASLGLACLEPDEAIDSLLARADTALYRAKQAGRNRCVVDLPPRAPSPPQGTVVA